MSNKMLINATQPEELRVAIISGNTLIDLDIEHAGREQKKSNIYKGRISRVEPSLEAAFVDYGAERHGFLPFKEIAPEYLGDPSNINLTFAEIRAKLPPGKEILVQVSKEERGTKGAALTTYITLPGPYAVLMPNNPAAGGISRRIEGEDRMDMREALSALDIPEGMGVIIRTAGVGRDASELQHELQQQLHMWQKIQEAYRLQPAPCLIHQESGLTSRALRDYWRPGIEEIHVDTAAAYTEVTELLKERVDSIPVVKLYEGITPLFSAFQVESQVRSAFQRELDLPSGGGIVFDYTEALVSIDINSGRATKGVDIEETALRTNIEAAEEIARQLRLRDIGGLIVIDFIDMESLANRRYVEERLVQAVQVDRARVQLGHISRFGLLEMSRQRLRAPLGEAAEKLCPRCQGQGRIRSPESLALSIIRLIEEDAGKDRTAQIQVQVPVEIAAYLANEKRRLLLQIETRHRVQVLIIPNPHLDTPAYKIIRIRTDEIRGAAEESSYALIEKPTVSEATPFSTFIATEQPAVQATALSSPSLSSKMPAKAKTGLFERLLTKLFPKREEETTTRKKIPSTITREKVRKTGERVERVDERVVGERVVGERNAGEGRTGNRRGYSVGARTTGRRTNERQAERRTRSKNPEPLRERIAREAGRTRAAPLPRKEMGVKPPMPQAPPYPTELVPPPPRTRSEESSVVRMEEPKVARTPPISVVHEPSTVAAPVPRGEGKRGEAPPPRSSMLYPSSPASLVKAQPLKVEPLKESLIQGKESVVSGEAPHVSLGTQESNSPSIARPPLRKTVHRFGGVYSTKRRGGIRKGGH